LSVLVDPKRAARVLGLETGPGFSAKVLYVYEKQLEEADIIVINKCDLLEAAQRDALERALRERFPHAEVVTVSARTGENLEQWFTRLSGPLAARQAMDIDYDAYAEGEALLGWLNATVGLSSRSPFDGNDFLQRVAAGVRDHLAQQRTEIAHFKMTLAPDTGDDLGVLNLVRTDGRAESPYRLAESLSEGELIVNLRAEGDPEALKSVVLTALDRTSLEAGVAVTVQHVEHFRPGRPQPTHRMAIP
jgi:G3E family GTPase